MIEVGEIDGDRVKSPKTTCDNCKEKVTIVMTDSNDRKVCINCIVEAVLDD